MFPGRILLGFGFIGFAVAWDLPAFLLIAPLAAFGSTAGDLPFLALMQRHFPVTQIGRVYGVRSAIESAGGGAGALIAVPFIALTVGGMAGRGVRDRPDRLHRDRDLAHAWRDSHACLAIARARGPD